MENPNDEFKCLMCGLKSTEASDEDVAICKECFSSISKKDVRKQRGIVYAICGKCHCVTPHNPNCMSCKKNRRNTEC